MISLTPSIGTLNSQSPLSLFFLPCDDAGGVKLEGTFDTAVILDVSKSSSARTFSVETKKDANGSYWEGSVQRPLPHESCRVS